VKDTKIECSMDTFNPWVGGAKNWMATSMHVVQWGPGRLLDGRTWDGVPT
jgi:hypothetical protein